jgi:hypothetical protein
LDRALATAQGAVMQTAQRRATGLPARGLTKDHMNSAQKKTNDRQCAPSDARFESLGLTQGLGQAWWVLSYSPPVMPRTPSGGGGGPGAADWAGPLPAALGELPAARRGGASAGVRGTEASAAASRRVQAEPRRDSPAQAAAMGADRAQGYAFPELLRRPHAPMTFR